MSGEKKIFLTLLKDWEALDGSDVPPKNNKVIIPKGRHEVVRINNPFGHPDAPWLVLKDTKIGGTEAYWRDWGGEQWGEFQIIVEEV